MIEPIKLLSGNHAQTATTGQGCFMNVIAYLNGEAQITDESPCVCVYVRPLAIKLNDLATDEQRQQLLPFVLRAMGSATTDPDVMAARRTRLRQYGEECDAAVQSWRAAMKKKNSYADADADADAYAYANADAYADANADAYADANANADAYAYAYAYAYANANANAYADAYAYAARLKASLFDAGLRYLDDVLPPLEPASAVVCERMGKLWEMQA